jgi:deoxyribonuclease V
LQARALHPWDLSPAQAGEVQRRLRRELRIEDGVRPADVRVVAGVDNGYLAVGTPTIGCSAAVALRLPAMEIVETRQVCVPVSFPYVPGLLAFRELPAMLAALEQMETEPDVILVDAHGYAHPRRMGAASHLGLLLDRPTIGCAKSRLVGRYEEPPPDLGAWRPLVDRGELVGAVVRSRPTGSPLFVSPGHRISIESAVAIVLACVRGRSIMPEPTRLADALVKAETRRRRQDAASGL